MTRIIVVSKNDDTLKSLIQAVKAEGLDVIASCSLAELPAILKEVPVNGILLDLITSTKASSREKQETCDLLQLYPHVNSRVIENEVRIVGVNRSLKLFLQDCRLFKARVIRKCERPIRYTGVLIATINNFDGAEKAVTLNATAGGCFVYTANEWTVGDPVWLRFKENDRVFQGIVCWIQPWGNDKKMPGIGITFVQEI